MSTNGKNFQHFILTRISIFHHKNGVLSDDWYQDRIKHIQKIWAPSIAQQTAQNFEVIGYVTETSPHWFISELKRYPWLKLEFEKAGDDRGSALGNWKAAVEQRINRDWIITTRLDSDDAINKDFVQILQNNFVPKTSVVNFDRGLLLYERHVFNFVHRSNPFISLIEPVTKGEVQTIYSFGHGSAREHHPVKHLDNENMFLVNIHGFNRVNSFGSKRRTLADPYLISPLFGIDPDHVVV